MGLDIDEVLRALRGCLPDREGPFPLSEPTFDGNEWAYVKECLDSGWVSSVGAFVDRLEEDLAAYTGAGRAVVTVNGTAALHAALLLAGVEPEDEVLVPALTFVATTNAVAYCGAVPHFIDSEETTLGVDPRNLAAHLDELADHERGACVNRRTGRRIRALVPMHTFGHPVDLDGIEAVCARHGIEMIEDAAEAIGSRYRGEHVGHRGRMGILSFNGNKTITTGGGGAILCDDPELAQRAKHLTTTAKVPHAWRFDHDRVGYNYRMPNINAALGCAQLEGLPELLEGKRILAKRYASALAGVEGVGFVTEPPDCTSNYWLNAILLEQEHAECRDDLLAAAHERGILARPAWTLQSELPMYRDCPRADLAIATSLQARLINLPSGPSLVATAGAAEGSGRGTARPGGAPESSR